MPPLHVALLSYRGNMFCGGQGVYVWNLARALAARGHRVKLLSGPPYPDPVPGAEILRLPQGRGEPRQMAKGRNHLLA